MPQLCFRPTIFYEKHIIVIIGILLKEDTWIDETKVTYKLRQEQVYTLFKERVWVKQSNMVLRKLTELILKNVFFYLFNRIIRKQPTATRTFTHYQHHGNIVASRN